MTALLAGGLFFPLRLSLRISGHGYSAAVLDKMVTAGGEHKSFQRAAVMMQKLAEVKISHTHVGRLTHEIGAELAAVGDYKAELHRYRQLPCDPDQPPVELACVEFDGGRINTRADQRPRGVHDSGWKESKVACLWRMTGKTFEEDPQPDVPGCFLDKDRVAKRVRQIKGRAGGFETDESDEPLMREDPSPSGAAAKTDKPRWQPERVFRTCVASLKDVHRFGSLVAAEA